MIKKSIFGKSKKLKFVLNKISILIGLFAVYILILLPNIKNNIDPNQKPDNLIFITHNDVLSNASFLPLKLVQYLTYKFSHHSIIAYKSLSVVIAIGALITFYYVLVRWRTKRVGLLGALLLGSSTLFLSTASSASPEIYYLLAGCLLPLAIVIIGEEGTKYDLIFIALITAMLLYAPGMWAFLILGVIFAFNNLKVLLEEFNIKQKLTALFVFLIAISPLIYSLIINTVQYKSLLLGSSYHLISLEFVKNNLVKLPEMIIVHGINNPGVWLISTPILDVFTIAMALLGVYAYKIGFHPVRFRGLIIYTIASIGLIGILGISALWLLLIPIYLFAARGIALMLQQWFSVFPKNPLARYLGVFVVIIALSFAVFYHVNRFYVVWPKNSPYIQSINSLK